VNPHSDRSGEVRQTKVENDPVLFSARDRYLVLKYYNQTGARNDHSVSREFRRGVQRNRILSNGLYKQLQPLPPDLEPRLSAVNSIYSRGLIGQDMVIVNTRSQRIMDVIRDVFGPKSRQNKL
jgi:hypothetical protein